MIKIDQYNQNWINWSDIDRHINKLPPIVKKNVAP
jgi:hypothetical protein